MALKLLVIWKRDGREENRVETARRFVESSRAAGFLSVLEGIAAPAPGQDDFDLDEGILDAAAALGPLGASLYKAQVPRQGRGDLSELVTACEKLDRSLSRPWVVLSSGVAAADFPTAVEAACRGGASGMLAGRAQWRGALATPDPAAAVREESVDRPSAVLVTCSSIGEAAEQARAHVRIPVHRIDEPMAAEAVAAGRRIGVLATLSATLQPTRDLLLRKAAEQEEPPLIQESVCPGAFEALRSGATGEHDAVVAAEVRRLAAEVDVLVLAQASMARVADALPADEVPVPVLTSPRSGLRPLRSFAADRSRRRV